MPPPKSILVIVEMKLNQDILTLILQFLHHLFVHYLIWHLMTSMWPNLKLHARHVVYQIRAEVKSKTQKIWLFSINFMTSIWPKSFRIAVDLSFQFCTILNSFLEVLIGRRSIDVWNISDNMHIFFEVNLW